MSILSRLKVFLPGKKALSSEINAEFDNIINGHNETVNVLNSHMKTGVDPSSSDNTKDKHVSNYDLKRIQDQIDLNVNNFIDGGNFTDVYTSQFAVLDGGEF
jgi:hypothetical protein